MNVNYLNNVTFQNRYGIMSKYYFKCVRLINVCGWLYNLLTPTPSFTHFSHLCSLLTNYAETVLQVITEFIELHIILWGFSLKKKITKSPCNLWKTTYQHCIISPNLQHHRYLLCFQTNHPTFSPQKLLHWSGFFFKIFIFSIIGDLQCSVNFYHRAKWPSHTYIYTFFFLHYLPLCSMHK